MKSLSLLRSSKFQCPAKGKQPRNSRVKGEAGGLFLDSKPKDPFTVTKFSAQLFWAEEGASKAFAERWSRKRCDW